MSEASARILYIDDDEGLRRLAERALSRRGYHVETAANGIEGVAKAEAGAFDLVAVDHYMPGQDGLTTLAQLGALPNPPSIVYVTGSDESSVAVAALKAGAVDYVVKGAGGEFFDLLARTFEQALGQRRLILAKDTAEAALRESNARLEALLREVNHRVANSLQIASAFVSMQAKALTDPAARAALEDTQRRIGAIALTHRSLYTSESVDTIEMDEYLAGLVRELERTWSTPQAPRKLALSAEKVALKTDRAVSVGIIVNELVSNACKYAYPAGTSGEVRIALARDNGDFLLTVEDDGCGLDPAAAAQGTGLGTKLIAAMAGSLRATLGYDPVPRGVRASLRAAAA
ncbi:sensor histidine kinase [Allosphingosinicella indica]|uniref:histidine kinase n=1 Tax=Allosphingosinicella indica TaxID=941907 RepID=A0A1X7GY32_9SPHN|nr:histidine kinase dimerization/phosphoacceptor domain -containing protein [Allosphingosinicella indica]SMF76285.1 Two-component sensor histidine kinase, contains HisKA and HATPase domains [Allosphingosinicella indica]